MLDPEVYSISRKEMDYSYLDGKLIHAQEFKWTAKGESVPPLSELTL